MKESDKTTKKKRKKRFNNVQDFMRNKKEIKTTPVSRVSIELMFV